MLLLLRVLESPGDSGVRSSADGWLLRLQSRDQETKRRATELLKALMAWGPTEPPKKVRGTCLTTPIAENLDGHIFQSRACC